MNKVVLSKEEGAWFSRNVLKTRTILESAAKKDPQTLERQTYRLLVSLSPKAQEMESILEQLKNEDAFEFELQLKQKQKLIVHEMIGNTINMIEEKVIPKYKERMLEDYWAESVKKVNLLKSMRRKFR